MDELYIGLMSGTSCDGIDACLVSFSNDEFNLIGSLYQAYPDEIRQSLLDLISKQESCLDTLSILDHDLAAINTLAVKRLLQELNVRHDSVKAIGYHGQTIYHCPQDEHRNSMQIGDPSFLATRASIPVVADFRRMDMAVGGQGAPMVPGFHQYLFSNPVETRAILNIGGIANLTILPSFETEDIIGFDTGPGNCLMDEWSLQHQQKPFDENGDWAKQGSVIPELLKQLQQDPYFAKPHPKSTGREYFNQHWLAQKLTVEVKPQDVQASLAQLTANSISEAIKAYYGKIQHVFVCGGGAHNEFLLSLIQAQLGPIKLDSTSALGLAPDWVEACAFAWLARQRIEGLVGNIPSVTGANKPVICGAVYQI